MSMMIRPVDALHAAAEQARVAMAGDSPIRINRDALGMVTVSLPDSSEVIMVKVNGAKKAKEYTGPFNLKDGGTVEAYKLFNPRIKASATFAKIEKVPAQVVFVNSEEPYEEAVLAIDGDPDSYWHTMYSVTVAQYPHWIDLDIREVKDITGVTYMPRQGGGENGDFKDYEVYVSLDGKNWASPLPVALSSATRKRRPSASTIPSKGSMSVSAASARRTARTTAAQPRLKSSLTELDSAT